jgi:hypothetical protein
VKRPVTLDDVEAAIRYRFRATTGDVDALRSLVAAYAETEGLALARQRVLGTRRGALMAATVPDALAPPSLRAAHAEVSWLRAAGRPVPGRLADLDRAYERLKKRAQRERAREAAGRLAGAA